jgi:hypothetical protein
MIKKESKPPGNGSFPGLKEILFKYYLMLRANIYRSFGAGHKEMKFH